MQLGYFDINAKLKVTAKHSCLVFRKHLDAGHPIFVTSDEPLTGIVERINVGDSFDLDVQITSISTGQGFGFFWDFRKGK